MYKDTDFREVLNTIKHEIAHALTPKQHHNKVWKDCAKRIGSDGLTFSSYDEWSTDKTVEKRKISVIDLTL